MRVEWRRHLLLAFIAGGGCGGGCGGGIVADGGTEAAADGNNGAIDAGRDVMNDVDPDSGVCCNSKLGTVPCTPDASIYDQKCRPDQVCDFGCVGTPGKRCCPP